MRTSLPFFPIPLLVRHTQPSGQEKLYPVLVSDISDPVGTRLVQYANGAEIAISEQRFIRLELAQSDLMNLAATPLPDEVIRRDTLH